MDGEQDVTRRDFLKTASAATGALALSHIGSTPMLGSPPPSDVVRYGVIGTGTQGCNLLRFLSTMAEGRCIATCDIYPPNLMKGIETIGSNPQAYQDYRQLLDRKDLDAVLICTPLNLHAPMVIAALDAGKHVFVEESMFLKEPEGEQLRKTAEAHPKQVLQVGLQWRSSALYKVAMQMVRKGTVGRVLFVRVQWHLNNDWRRPVPDAKDERLINWRMYRESSGGLLAEFGSHQIDVANWAIDADPVSVVAMGGIDHWKDGRETCDNVQAIFEYPGGEKLSLSALLFNGHYGFEEQILGDQGTLIISKGKGLYFREKLPKVSSGASKEKWNVGATVIAATSEKGVPIFPERITDTEPFLDREVKYAKRWLASMGIYEYEEPHDPWYSEMANFFVSIREGKPVSAPLELGISVAQGVIYANRAIDTGLRVFWPKRQV
jgi:predicted dehydrogenase